jgi:hypothetical protein
MNNIESILRDFENLDSQKKALEKQVRELDKQISPLKSVIIEHAQANNGSLVTGNFLAVIKQIEVESMTDKASAIEAHGYQWLQLNNLLKSRTDIRLAVTPIGGAATLKVGV